VALAQIGAEETVRFKNLDLNLLVLLSSLLATRSVSESGRRLNLSQPAVSAGLARLRAYFNDPLFVGAGRGMAPTAFVQSLAPIVARAMAEIEMLAGATAEFDPLTSERAFHIGASDYLSLVAIAPLLPRLRSTAPGVTIHTFPASEQMLQGVETGELDFIITPEEFLSADHPSFLFFEERHVVVGWAENPIFAEGIDERGFFEAGHVVVEIGGGRRRAFAERQLGQMPHPRRIEVTANSFAVVPWMLVGTHRLAVMHERLARLCQKALPLTIAPLPFEFPLMRQMVQLHRSRQADPGVGWLLGALKDAVLTSDP